MWCYYGFPILAIIVLLFLTGYSDDLEGTLNKEASYALIKRGIPECAANFEVEYIPTEDGKDVFELEQVRDKMESFP